MIKRSACLNVTINDKDTWCTCKKNQIKFYMKLGRIYFLSYFSDSNQTFLHREQDKKNITSASLSRFSLGN